MGSYDTGGVAPPVLDADRIAENTSMEGSTDEGGFTWSEEYVGGDVTGATRAHLPGLDIEASIA